MKVHIKADENFHYVSSRGMLRKVNLSFQEYRRKWKEWPENFYAGGFPLFIDIETTSVCNLKCPFCATTFKGGKLKKGYMSFELVKKIIDEGAENGLYGVKFNIRGEPLLHPEIHTFVKYAKKKGLMDVYFNTNGMLLSKDMAKKLIVAGLDRISISFEGYTKKVYEKYRVGAKYETVLANIQSLLNLREDTGAEHPKVRIQTVLLPEMKNKMDRYRDFWRSRADEVTYLDYKEMKDKKKGVQYPWACPQLWQRMAVWWDGTILPCNHDDEGRLSLGNIKDISIKEAWNSLKLNAVRRKHKLGLSHEISACDGCYLRDSEIIKARKGLKIL